MLCSLQLHKDEGRLWWLCTSASRRCSKVSGSRQEHSPSSSSGARLFLGSQVSRIFQWPHGDSQGGCAAAAPRYLKSVWSSVSAGIHLQWAALSPADKESKFWSKSVINRSREGMIQNVEGECWWRTVCLPSACEAAAAAAEFIWEVSSPCSRTQCGESGGSRSCQTTNWVQPHEAVQHSDSRGFSPVVWFSVKGIRV